ncbi:MAG: Dyp-type peroxidase [Actinobacteria bacterium]|nr:Dyp-type peroxidase [Actinomycetota bacterium]
MTRRTLQPGIYYETEAIPHPSYRLVLLNVSEGAERRHVREALVALMEMLAGLGEGRLRSLEQQQAPASAESLAQYGGLDALIGYGRRLFDDAEHEPALTDAARPDFLSYLHEQGPFPALPWATRRRDAEADIALQLTGLNEAAVNCAAIEIWKLIRDQQLPLSVSESFEGYGRADKRGWLGFHDGVSNMGSGERLAALLASADPDWMRDGTYMAYLRIVVDLGVWEARSRAEQELIVGRDKLTGAALVAVARIEEKLVPVTGPAPDEEGTLAEGAEWRDPPQTTDVVLEASHIARANQTRASPAAPGSFRIFRQGYDFLEELCAEHVELGLNFVGFQRDLRVMQQVLHLPGWLGDANFGGLGDEAAIPLLTVVAGGFYAVPPNGERLPGAGLFGHI